MNEGAASQLVNTMSSPDNMDMEGATSTILRDIYGQEGLLNAVRGSKLDPFSAQDMQNWSKHSEEIQFTPNAQLATPASVGKTTYSVNSSLAIQPNTVEIEYEINISNPSTTTNNNLRLLSAWYDIIARQIITIGTNRAPINSSQGADTQSRMLNGMAERAKLNTAHSTNFAGVTGIFDTNNDQSWFIVPWGAGVALNYTTRAIARPQSQFFDCIKLLPRSTPIEITHDWNPSSAKAALTSSSAVAGDLAVLAATTVSFRVVSIRCNGFNLTNDMEEILNIYTTPSDMLSLGQTNWGQLGTTPQLLSADALAGSGAGAPYQYREFYTYTINPGTNAGGK